MRGTSGFATVGLSRCLIVRQESLVVNWMAFWPTMRAYCMTCFAIFREVSCAGCSVSS